MVDQFVREAIVSCWLKVVKLKMEGQLLILEINLNWFMFHRTPTKSKFKVCFVLLSDFLIHLREHSHSDRCCSVGYTANPVVV